ncbi:MAG: hypothetical protein HQK49_18430 [Oligoflexia bacterium]|nr:hypothetical protein [Oligoflexia bacterium]
MKNDTRVSRVNLTIKFIILMIFNLLFFCAFNYVFKNTNIVHASCTEKYKIDFKKIKESLLKSQYNDQHNDQNNNQLQFKFIQFDEDEIKEILRLGNEDEIFCSPWLLNNEQIVNGIRWGQFANSYIRVLKEKMKLLHSITQGTQEQVDCRLDINAENRTNQLDNLLKKVELQKKQSIFPEAIYLRDPKVGDFTGNFYYFLNPIDHKIYVKARTDNQQGCDLYLLLQKPQKDQLPALAIIDNELYSCDLVADKVDCKILEDKDEILKQIVAPFKTSPLSILDIKVVETDGNLFDKMAKLIKKLGIPEGKSVIHDTIHFKKDFCEMIVQKRGHNFKQSRNGYQYQRGGKWDNFDLNKEKIGARDSWNIHNGDVDLLGPKKKRVLRPDEYVVEIQAPGEFVFALTNKRMVYFFQPTYKKLPTTWVDYNGAPFSEKVYLPQERRGWTVSNSLIAKPGSRRSEEYMHPDDIVSFYNDGEGKKVAFEFTGTTYVLSPKGDQIRYIDTGLPGDFSKGFLTPENGKFKADNLSAAGSTIFIIGKDKNGNAKMYTYMYDFEIGGSCPGLTYTYKKKGKGECDSNNKVIALEQANRRLPMEPWKSVEDITLEGKAAITKNISIHLTGKGDDARELRVEGLNAKGESGFYFKKINESKWNFQIVDSSLSRELRDIISNNNLKKEGEVKEIKEIKEIKESAITMDYPQGQIIVGLGVDNKQKIKNKNKNKNNDINNDIDIKNVELLNFHYFQTPDQPATLRVKTNSGKNIDLLLRSADLWNPIKQSPENPWVIGTKDGVSKTLFATLDIPDQYLNSSDLEIKEIIEKYFKQYHHVVNLFTIAASDESVKIISGTRYRLTNKAFDVKNVSPLVLKFKRNSDGGNNKTTPYLQIINEKELVVDDLEKSNRQKVLQKLQKNKELLQRINNELSGLEKGVLGNALMFNALSKVVAPIASLVLNVSKQTESSEFLASADELLPRAFVTPANVYFKKLYKGRSNETKLALKTLKQRIKDYSKLERKLKRNIEKK